MIKYAELIASVLLLLISVLCVSLPWVVSWGSSYEKQPEIEFKTVCDRKDKYGRELCRLAQVK